MSKWAFLVSWQYFTFSLFDSGPDRFGKLRESATRAIINQVGLAFFVFDHDTMAYTAHPYNFYVCPASFGPIDDTFVCQGRDSPNS
jgi:hypothetical protein